MRLGECSFLADENVQQGVVDWLRGSGCPVVTASELGLGGGTDRDVLREAFARRLVVLTHDSDFGQLAIAEGEPYLGIVYVRPGHIAVNITTETLEVVLRLALDVEPPFVIVAERRADTARVRVREQQSGS